MLQRTAEFCGVFLSFSDVSSEMVELTITGPSRSSSLAQFIGEMLIEGLYFVIDMLARQRFYIAWFFPFHLLHFTTLPFFSLGFSLAFGAWHTSFGAFMFRFFSQSLWFHAIFSN